MLLNNQGKQIAGKNFEGAGPDGIVLREERLQLFPTCSSVQTEIFLPEDRLYGCSTVTRHW